MSISAKNRRNAAGNAERGFALLLVMFMASLVLLGAMVAAPYIRTEGQREKEQEMIWRGKQYVRGVKLYYRKTGHFPTSVDDLTKPKLGSLRFMRQAYKDPMNKEDGSWRMIYVGPGGQLIGSLKPQQQALQLPGQPGVPAGANAQQNSSFTSGFGQTPAPQPSATQNGAAPGAANSAAPQAGTPAANSAAADDAAAAAAPSGLVSDSPLIGGNIIGVGSKVNKRSVIIYDKAKNYRLFEFIWNPSKDLANAINQQIGTPNQNQQGNAPGQTGFGGGFGTTTPTNPPPAGTPTPAPPPSQNPPQQ